MLQCLEERTYTGSKVCIPTLNTAVSILHFCKGSFIFVFVGFVIPTTHGIRRKGTYPYVEKRTVKEIRVQLMGTWFPGNSSVRVLRIISSVLFVHDYNASPPPGKVLNRHIRGCNVTRRRRSFLGR